MNILCRVVVADDNHDAADSLALMIECLGYSAHAAYDGREAVEASARYFPELAILDVQMPALDGCAAARHLRSMEKAPVCIASLTALDPGTEPFKSQAHAFDVHLTKPPKLEEITALLFSVLGAPAPYSR